MEEPRKVQITAPGYYSRKEVQEAIFNFCKHRETVPRYLEGFGKRPDALDYPTDILTFVKRGATSFHCSEEIWSDPLKISTEMTPEKYREIRTGWDFLVDIDSKYLDHSKVAAKIIVNFLEQHGIKNLGIKFSGGKGFHILIPFAAFPPEFVGEKTSDKFPEWPRAIAGYLFESIKEDLNKAIIGLSDKEDLKKKGELIEQNFCPRCKQPTETKVVFTYKCSNPRCKSEIISMTSNKKILRCSCQGDLKKVGEKTISFCNNCKINTAKLESSGGMFGNLKKETQEQFKKEETTKSYESSVDIILVSPRHLFRAPYSLHEKTSLVSAVLTKEELENFEVEMADPLKVKFRNYNPICEKDEARELLMQALDWSKKKAKPEKKYEGKSIDLKGLTITEDMFPPAIKKIMGGLKQDGRKRALTVLLSFFTSLDFPKDYIEEKIDEWNKKNYKLLQDGYIKSQIEWSLRNKRLPPNYDKTTYKEILGFQPETNGLKNPINYTIREAMKTRGNQEKQTNSK